MKTKLGSELDYVAQREALVRFRQRYTKDHVPAWASRDVPPEFGTRYPVQYASDAEWLALTIFAVRSDGHLDERAAHCMSGMPTWPDNPELRKPALAETVNA